MLTATVRRPSPLRPHHLLAMSIWLVASHHTAAAPRLPASDSVVVERVPARAIDPRARDLQALREAWRADPRNVELAVRLAARYFDEAGAQGDPRYVGYAQAALAPWWNEAAPPIAVRVQRAVLRQYGHQFDEALADLDAVAAAEPDNAEAWSWLAAIHMVRADYVRARSEWSSGTKPMWQAMWGAPSAAAKSLIS